MLAPAPLTAWLGTWLLAAPSLSDLQSAMIDVEIAGCPGLLLSATCGNAECDALLGETPTNCQADCRPALVESWYDQETKCTDVQVVFEPETTEEVQEAVMQSLRMGRRVRVVGSRHSASNILCGDGSTIVTAGLDDIVGLETYQGETVVTVETGARLGDVARWLADRGYSLGYGITGFEGISVGGAMGGGVHGTSPEHPASFSSAVVSLELVGADGSVQELGVHDTDPEVFAALRTSLGLLGVVTRVRLRVVPRFRLAVNVDYLPGEALFVPGGYRDLVAGCDFGYLNWYPGVDAIVRVCGMETDEPADPGARSTLLSASLPEALFPLLVPLSQAGACNEDFACLVEAFRFGTAVTSPPFAVSDGMGGERPAHALVGWDADLMTASMPSEMPKLQVTDWEAAVPGHEADEALQVVRDILQAENRCLPAIGVFLRYDRAEPTTLLGPNAALGSYASGEDVLHIEMTTFLPYGFSAAREEDHDAPFVDILTTLLEAHEARLHWGKNRDALFAYAGDPAARGERIERFQAVLDAFDPFGVFGNDWAAAAGFSWPRAGEDFSEFYFPGSNPCGCPIDDAQVCDRDDRVTYPNPCRAACGGVSGGAQLGGSCDEYRFGSFRGLFGVRWHTATRFGELLPAAIWR